MVKSDLVAIRDYAEDDKNFILATWLRGLRYGCEFFKDVESKAYFNTYQKALQTVLANKKTRIQVACLKEDPAVILGYVSYSGDVLHWVFCKREWRGIGIAKSLVPEGIKTVSHLTGVGKKILRNHPGVVFNPFA